MIRAIFVGAVVLIFILGCAEENLRSINTYDIEFSPSDSTLIFPEEYEIEELFAPAFFSLQSNKKALVVTPRMPTSQYSLFYFPHEDMDSCCSRMNGLMRAGRGPGESGAIVSGARTYDGDRLIYYSLDTSRFYHFDQDLNLIDDPLMHIRDLMVTGLFTYRNGRYYTEASFSDEEKILRVYDTNSNTSTTLIDYRIPLGYQPAARNTIASIVSTPEEVLVALVGEKEILVINDENKIEGKIIIGENDPLPKPFKPSPYERVKSTTKHIFKMEYHDGMIFILMESGLIVLNNEFKFVTRFVFSNNNKEKLAISDFTVNSNKLYLRHGLSSVYRVNYLEIKNAIQNI